ncbi:MAG: hypothetical protein QW112_03115, partial [Candidatus Micrarchaeia archaeon]
MPKYSATIHIPMDAGSITAACKVLESEMEFRKRAEIEIGRGTGRAGEGLSIIISSEDISSLHAAVGSILRAVKIIL